MSRRLKHRWTLAVIAALTAFAQFVMAAEPCMLMHQPPTSMEHQVAAADEQCEAMPMDKASCLAQCLGGDESVSTLTSLFTAAMAPAMAWMDFTLAGTRFVAVAERDAPPCGPPLQILYCSYQS